MRKIFCRGQSLLFLLFLFHGDPDGRIFLHIGRTLNCTVFIYQVQLLSVAHDSGDHSAVFPEVIIAAVDFHPAGRHHAFVIKVIALAVYGLPPADPPSFLIKIESIIFQGEPSGLIGAVPQHVAPDSLYLIPLGRTIRVPEGTAGKASAIDRDTPSAGRCLKVIAVILTCVVGAVSCVFYGAKIVLNTGIMVLQLIFKVGKLAVYG